MRCGAAAASTCARRLKTHHCVFRSTEREGGRVGIVTRVAGLHVATDLRDAAVQRCSAVMISQFSGIVSKPNFFVEVNDGHVLVYLHNVNYSKDQIRLAVDVIDHLSSRVGARAAAAAVPKEVLDGINDEVQRFVKKKEALATTIRDTHRTLLAQLDELHLPVLFKLLSETYTSPQTQTYVCPLCNAAFPTKRGLSGHKRTHNRE